MLIYWWVERVAEMVVAHTQPSLSIQNAYLSWRSEPVKVGDAHFMHHHTIRTKKGGEPILNLLVIYLVFSDL